MNKETISKLNEIAKEDFEKAKSMLDGINLVLKTKYGWLNKRVVFFENPDSSVAKRYTKVHDAYAYAEEQLYSCPIGYTGRKEVNMYDLYTNFNCCNGSCPLLVEQEKYGVHNKEIKI